MNRIIQKSHNEATPENNKGRVRYSVYTLPDGGQLLENGIRLDPYGGGCLVSNHHLNKVCIGNQESLIPEQFRPRLSEIKSFLQSGPGLTLRRRHPRPFSLLPMEHASACEVSALEENVDDNDFSVLGLLALNIEKAVEIFCNLSQTEIGPDSWIPPMELYQQLTHECLKKVKNVSGTFCISAPENLAKQGPIVDSQRFKRTGASIFKALLQFGYNAVLLKGKAGAGKSRLMSYIGHKLTHMCVPPRLQGHLLVGIGIELFMPSNSTLEEAEKSKLRTMMTSQRVIWVIDEASRMVERGNTSSLDNLLMFIDQGAKLILLSDQSYLLEKREAFTRRLSPVYLRPAGRKEVFEIATVLAHHQAKKAGLNVVPEAIATAVKCSYASSFAQPHAVASLISGTIAGCEIQGKKQVSPACVEREAREMFSQGDELPLVPESILEFISILRKRGYCGHEAFLKHFGRRLLGALRRRFKVDREEVVWSCFLLGNSGNGKSTLLNMVAEMITGSEHKILVIQCSSYQQEHAVQSLIGSPKSYIGYEEGGVLQNFVKQNPDGVIIIEEPELGHPNLLRVLLQILEGAFTAGDGSVLSTKGITVFISSNAGCESNKTKLGFGSSSSDQKNARIQESLEALLPTALLSRIGADNIFYLEPLTSEALRNILRLAAHNYGRAEGVAVCIEEDVIHHIVANEETDRFGARAMLDRFRNEVEFLLDEKLSSDADHNIMKLHVFLDKSAHIQCEAEYGASDSNAENAPEPKSLKVAKET